MFDLLFRLLFGTTQSDDPDREPDPDVSGYPDNDNDNGRWSQHDISIRDNIDAGMAVKE